MMDALQTLYRYKGTILYETCISDVVERKYFEVLEQYSFLLITDESIDINTFVPSDNILLLSEAINNNNNNNNNNISNVGPSSGKTISTFQVFLNMDEDLMVDILNDDNLNVCFFCFSFCFN